MGCGRNSYRIPRVYSVSNLDGTLTISPTTGDVVASLEAALYADILAAVAGIHNPVSLGTPNGLSLAAGQVLSLGLATASVAGALSAADWSTFNAKQSALTFGDLTVGSNLSVSGGTGAVIGAGASISLGTNVVTAISNDTNVTGSIASNTLTLGWTGTLADARIASAATWNAKENALTFNSPLSRSVNTISLGVVPLSLGGANAALTAAAGGLVYSTTTALAIQAAGVSGYFARSGGTGAPTWFNLFGTSNIFSVDQTILNVLSLGALGATSGSLILYGASDGFSGTIARHPLSNTNKTWTFPNVTGTVALLEAANVFTANQTISNTAPSLVLTDTTASAKSLTIAVDANVASFRESAGSANSFLVFDLANLRVGNGVAPEVDFHQARSANTFMILGAATSGAPQAGIIGRTSRGSLTSPTATQSNDDLLRLEGRGRGATAYTTTARSAIRLLASEIWTDSAQGSYIALETTPDGSTTRAEVLRVSQAGNLGIRTSTFGTSAKGVLGIANAGIVPSTSPANMIQLYAKDSSAGTANSTLAIRTEQVVEAIGTFTASHKLRVWINEVEYYMTLDAV